MIKLSNRKEVVTVTHTDTYKLSNKFELVVTIVNGKISHQIINILDDSIKFIGGNVNGRSYENYAVLVQDGFREECKKKYFYSESTIDDVGYWYNDYVISDPLTYLQNNEFDESKIILINGGIHSFLDSNGEYLDILRHADYISIHFVQKANDYEPLYDWEKLKKHLSNFPGISNFKEILVPYYNADFSGQKALEFDIVFKGEWMPKNNYYDWRNALKPFGGDVLNVRQFILEQK